MANVMQPGHGMNLDPSQLDTKSVQKYISQTTEVSASSEIMHILKDACLLILSRLLQKEKPYKF